MSDIDSELKLLSGLSFYVDNIEIRPLTLREIVNIGYVKYTNCLNVFMLNIEDVLSVIPEEYKGIHIFDLILLVQISNLLEATIETLKIFLNTNDVKSDIDNQVIVVNNKKYIHRKNWDEICNVIKLQNCIDDKIIDNKDVDATTKALLEKRDKARKIIAKVKGGDNESLNLADLVSILAANGNGINLLNVWDLSFYAFNDQFNRMKMLEDFNINIRMLLAGAKSEDINLKYWMTKIRTND